MRMLLGLLFLIFAATAHAAEPPALTIHYFRADGCPHCEDAGAFFARLAAEEPRLIVRDYEVSHMALVPRILKALQTKIEEQLDEREPWARDLIDKLAREIEGAKA